MIIVNGILYLSSAWYNIFSFNQFFIIKILPCWFVTKSIGSYRKYNIFFNFRFTENMIFPSIAENQENVIFTLSVFTKMLFFIQWCKAKSFFILLIFLLFTIVLLIAFVINCYLRKYQAKQKHLLPYMSQTTN